MTRACSRCLLEDRLQSPHTCGRPDATVSPEEHRRVQAEAAELRDRLAEIQRLPEADWASVTSTIAQLAASVARSGGRDVAVQMVAALDRGKVYVDRRLAESADLRKEVQALEQRESQHRERAKAAEAVSADLRARLERAEARRFPIMGGPSIPWAMIAPHARQAKQNHDQTLERLAERGGLSPREAVLVLESRPGREWRQMSEAEGLARLTALLAAWESSQCAAEVRRAVEEEREACAMVAWSWGGAGLEIADEIRERAEK